MMAERLLKIVTSGGVAILTALIAYANIRDPGPNLTYLTHVLTMDTIPLESAMAAHAVHDAAIHNAIFATIVAGEAATAALFAAGTVELWRSRNAKARVFHNAKRFVFLGAACGFLVWFVGFAAIGGEWFAMWESPIWNGQQPAFRFYIALLLIATLVAQPDAEF